MARLLPMFPLGTVLFPSAFLPLHVFEPRYLELVRDCLADEPEFGVVLIERGSEVGGGDVRTGIGTVARILDTAAIGDSRLALATVGTRRIEVRSWLPDDPYPRAEVVDLPDPPPAAGDADRYGHVLRRLRRVLALSAELGEAGPEATTELADDPGLGSFQAAALAPITPFDRQRVLATVGVTARLDLLDALLADEATVREQRLSSGFD
jgi:Lon protease-like protein